MTSTVNRPPSSNEQLKEAPTETPPPNPDPGMTPADHFCEQVVKKFPRLVDLRVFEHGDESEIRVLAKKSDAEIELGEALARIYCTLREEHGSRLPFEYILYRHDQEDEYNLPSSGKVKRPA